MSAIGSYDPSNVDPSTATTPIVFSSQYFTAASGVRWYVSPSIGASRISTSQ